MPIIERDLWRQQYFTGVQCPPDIYISTDDQLSFELYPDHRWIYDKTNLCKTQGLAFGLHGTRPERYPVFTKPATNLYGMGIDSYLLRNEMDYRLYCKPGNFWMEYLTGDHISTDLAVINGEVVWQGHVEGIAAGEGTFDYWLIPPDPRPALEDYCQKWLREHLGSYTGMVNIESIGGKIIEVHLRFADQWPDLYGPGWVEAVVKLYKDGVWNYEDHPHRAAYSVVLFGPHNREYAHPPQRLLAELRRTPGISSLQITFNEGLASHNHAMPPGGFRLAVVNCFDLTAGQAVRERLAEFFDVTEEAPLRAAVGR